MESWVEPNLEIILKEIIENLGQLEQNILPTLDILVRVVAAHVGKNCHMHGLIRDAVLKIYYISKALKDWPDFEINKYEFLLWLLGVLKEITPMDASNLLQEDYLDLLSTRVLEVEMESLSKITQCKNNLDKLMQRLEKKRSTDRIKEVDSTLKKELDDLLRAIPTFVGINMGLLGLLTTQVELALSMGDFDAAFTLLNQEIRRLESRMRISSDKNKTGEELDHFLIRLRENQFASEVAGQEWVEALPASLSVNWKAILKRHPREDFAAVLQTSVTLTGATAAVANTGSAVSTGMYGSLTGASVGTGSRSDFDLASLAGLSPLTGIERKGVSPTTSRPLSIDMTEATAGGSFAAVLGPSPVASVGRERSASSSLQPRLPVAGTSPYTLKAASTGQTRGAIVDFETSCSSSSGGVSGGGSQPVSRVGSRDATSGAGEEDEEPEQQQANLGLGIALQPHTMDDCIASIEEKLNAELGELRAVYQQIAAARAQQQEQELATWLRSHLEQRELVRREVDAIAEEHLSTMGEEVKAMSEKYSEVYKKSRDLYLSARQKVADPAAAAAAAAGASEKEDKATLSLYDLTLSGRRQKMVTRGPKFRFKKDAVLAALEEIHVAELQQWGEVRRLASDSGRMVDLIHRDVEESAAAYSAKAQAVLDEASTRYSEMDAQARVLTVAAYRTRAQAMRGRGGGGGSPAVVWAGRGARRASRSGLGSPSLGSTATTPTNPLFNPMGNRGSGGTVSSSGSVRMSSGR